MQNRSTSARTAAKYGSKSSLLFRQAPILAILMLSAVYLSSCGSNKKENYPKYSIKIIEYVPDSSKSEYRKFITETVRAASQQMTGGDYEDVDETIIQAQRTADDIFMVKIIGLEKILNADDWKHLNINPSEFNIQEKRIFDSLQNSR